jgi:hypothetical protein
VLAASQRGDRDVRVNNLEHVARLATYSSLFTLTMQNLEHPRA